MPSQRRTRTLANAVLDAEIGDVDAAREVELVRGDRDRDTAAYRSRSAGRGGPW